MDGWTVISRSGRWTANLMAAILQARGLRVEVLGGRVMVPDNQVEIAQRIISEAEFKRPFRDGLS